MSGDTKKRIADLFADTIVRNLGGFDMLGSGRAGYSRTEFMAEALGAVVSAQAMAGTRNESVERLRALLSETFMAERPWANAEHLEEWERGRPYHEASADYGCDYATRRVFVQAGVDPSLFPIKSRVRAHTEYAGRDDYEGSVGGLYVAIGYGARGEFFWPMSGGRWLVTKFSLDREDREALVALAETGVECAALKVVSLDAAPVSS